MSKFLQFCIISLFLLVGFIGCILGCFAINNLFSLIILILFSILLFISSIYSFIFALSFKIGKKIKAIITDKQYIPSDNNDHSDNGYYKFIYQVNLNNKIKTKSFKIYFYNDYLAKNLNIGNEIELNKLLFITSFDKSNITKNNNDLCQSQKKHNSIRLKKELIIGLSIFAILSICCLIYIIKNIR